MSFSVHQFRCSFALSTLAVCSAACHRGTSLVEMSAEGAQITVVIYAWAGNVGDGILLCKLKRFPHRGRRPLSYEEEISYQRAIALVSAALGSNGGFLKPSWQLCAGRPVELV